ncbi:predicted protein [Naegleria gruberi]|uniref:Predicted protein n=1 Tax=Naegleria gruberi TaxID=5762 RepID=D2W676_NAEGR|nr:uncharacterized protein NAEGRDRAFT_60095 [Naegleria gruberi]EFC35425.1 predicted protein [Naegleria gruberi]|eukprot:XP_002668169.1 predicted protein [Naegleria gruberi strain NEG-M]
MWRQVIDDNYFSDVYLVTREGDINDDDEIIHNLFKSLLKLMKKISHSRSQHLTNENVQYLRMAVRVKRRSASELSKLESKYENDRLLIWLAVRSFGVNALKHIRNEKFKCDREIIKAGLESDGSILFACTIPREELRDDEELILKGLETCPRVLELANDRIRNDRSVVESVLKRDGMQLKYCGESVKNDRNMIGIALKQNIESCKFIPVGIVEEQLVLRVVLSNGLLLVHFPEFNSNRNVVIVSVKQNGLALEFASNELRSDEEIVKLAMETQKDALLLASPTLLIRKEFMDNLVSKMISWGHISPKISEIIKKYSDYEEFMLSRYERGYEFPNYLSNSLSVDNWIRILAGNINLFRSFFEYYSKSKELVSDVNFLLKLAQKMKIDADFKESYSDYLELQKEMILKQPSLLYYFDPSLKSDVPLMSRILRETSLYIEINYFDKSLFENREFLLALLKKYSYNWVFITTFDDELYECGVVDSSYYFGKYLEKYCNNKEYLIRAIKRNSNLFEILSHKLDEEDRMQLTKNNSKEVKTTNYLTDRIERLSDEEKKDKELIIGHLKISPMSFPFIDPSLKNDIDVVMATVTKHGGVLKLLSPRNEKE